MEATDILVNESYFKVFFTNERDCPLFGSSTEHKIYIFLGKIFFRATTVVFSPSMWDRERERKRMKLSPPQTPPFFFFRGSPPPKRDREKRRGGGGMTSQKENRRCAANNRLSFAGGEMFTNPLSPRWDKEREKPLFSTPLPASNPCS